MKKAQGTYVKIKGTKGIYKNTGSNNYMAVKKVNGVKYQETFLNITDAKQWWRLFNAKDEDVLDNSKTTLKDVWGDLVEFKFPRLSIGTREIWTRRYKALKDLENIPLSKLTGHAITRWIENQVKYFKSDEYLNLSRGNAKRCNLDNEINLLSHLLNYYKQSMTFEEESAGYINPVRIQEFKRQGFVRPKPVKASKITATEAVTFFEYLKPLYYDLALLQYLTASRIGEISGLQWSRIDFERKQITIMETCSWSNSNKMFQGLNPHPKNKTPRICSMTPLMEACLRRLQFLKSPESDFVFQINGTPLNYCTIQSNYRGAFRKAGLPFNSQTHCMRHGAATLARKLGGSLDAVIAVTGHKDMKLADHYSKIDEDFQKDVFHKLSSHVEGIFLKGNESENVLTLDRKKVSN